MNFTTLKSFLESVKCVKDVTKDDKNYCEDISFIFNLLHYLYPLLTDRSIKGRFIRIRKKLDNNVSTISPHGANTYEDSSAEDTSQSEDI